MADNLLVSQEESCTLEEEKITLTITLDFVIFLWIFLNRFF